MRIERLHKSPLAHFQFLNAARRGGVPNVERLEVLHATCSGMPPSLHAIIAAADLQGLEHWGTANGRPPRLMGEVIPRLLVDRVLGEHNLDPNRTGVFLCGDLYTVPGATRRGGTGDVTAVWEAFADRFLWVAGVAGNHDMFENETGEHPAFPSHMQLLDGDTASLTELTVSGLGGIIGNPQRNRRRSEQQFCELLELMLADPCDVLLMHDGPDGPDPGQKGSPAIREILQAHSPPLVIRGHAHWDSPLTELLGGTQVLNVDSRIVVLTPSS